MSSGPLPPSSRSNSITYPTLYPSPSLSLSVPSYFPSFSYVWMSTNLPQDIAGSLLLNTYTSRSTSIVRPLPTPPPPPSPHTHQYIERSSHVSLPHTNLTLPSNIPVGQSPYIFDLHTHTISMALFIDLAPTHLIFSSTLSISMTPPSLLVDHPLYI